MVVGKESTKNGVALDGGHTRNPQFFETLPAPGAPSHHPKGSLGNRGRGGAQVGYVLPEAGRFTVERVVTPSCE